MNSRVKRVIGVGLVALGMVGCATYAWQKPGVTAEIAQQDASECDRQARLIASDYAAWTWSRWPDPWYGARGYPFVGPPWPDATWQFELERRAFDRCMEVKGYRLVEQPR